LYPWLHEYFRATHVPLLAVWGRGDQIFGPAGAATSAADLPDADIHVLDGGHFLLESDLRAATRRWIRPTSAEFVQEKYARFDGPPIRDFIPLFVERNGTVR
jgi:pimeloyl-ACP methyl ester carboxylesterase